MESASPLSHIKKTFLVKGDASITIHDWLNTNPAIAIGLAIFDMDVYQPTRDVFRAIKSRLFKGSILVLMNLVVVVGQVKHWHWTKFLAYQICILSIFPHQPHCAICVIE